MTPATLLARGPFLAAAATIALASCSRTRAALACKVCPRTSGENRLALIEDDLPLLARSLLAAGPHRRALLGFSMGGYGALIAAERHPERYRAVAVAAPALFPNYADERNSVGDAFDDAAQFAAFDAAAGAARLTSLPVRIRIGDQDPFVAASQHFAKLVPHADLRVVPGGCHNDCFWRSSAGDMLAFAIAHF